MSDLRIEVLSRADGRVSLVLGDLRLTLAPDARDKLRELLDRAAMAGQHGSGGGGQAGAGAGHG